MRAGLTDMQIAWQSLARYFAGAFALYLVLEGLLPFMSPRTAQRLMSRLVEAEPRRLRVGGFVSVVAGIALLWVALNG